MKAWKFAGLGIIAFLGIAAIYPGIPVGAGISTVNSDTKLTCHYLHWTGLRSRVIDYGKATTVNDAACWSWK
jgi:hypothetical protein